MRKTILIALAMFLALSSSLNANESMKKSLLTENKDIAKFLANHSDLNVSEMAQLLLEWKNEAIESWFWEKKFFKYLWKAYLSSKPYLLKKLKKETPNFIASLTNWWQSFWKLSIYIAKKKETLAEKQETREVTALLEREKQETRESEHFAQIARNIWKILEK